MVPGDAKALVVLDINEDGAPDFACTRNNSTMLVFQNQPADDRRFLRVSLQGRPGNPTAIGARLALRLTDGTGQVAEVAAGSGYWSQSTAACYFGYTTDNPPRQLEVRWPHGETTRHEIPAGQRTLSLTTP